MFDFGGNQNVLSLDAIPEDFRGLYTEKDGKFTLASDHPGVKSAVAALLRIGEALTKTRADLTTARTAAKAVDLSALSEYGDTVDEIRTAFGDKLKDASKGKGPADLQSHLDRQKKEMETQFETTLKGEQNRSVALTKQLHNLLVVNGATAALVESKAISAELAMPHVVRQVRVDEEDGVMIAKVVDDSGEVRYSGSTGKPMTVKELVSEMKGKDAFKPLFQSEAKGGGGTPPRGPARSNVQDPNKMSAQDKISAGLDQRQK